MKWLYRGIERNENWGFQHHQYKGDTSATAQCKAGFPPASIECEEVHIVIFTSI